MWAVASYLSAACWHCSLLRKREKKKSIEGHLEGLLSNLSAPHFLHNVSAAGERLQTHTLGRRHWKYLCPSLFVVYDIFFRDTVVSLFCPFESVITETAIVHWLHWCLIMAELCRSLTDWHCHLPFSSFFAQWQLTVPIDWLADCSISRLYLAPTSITTADVSTNKMQTQFPLYSVIAFACVRVCTLTQNWCRQILLMECLISWTFSSQCERR